MTVTVTRLSPISGLTHALELPMTEEEFQAALNSYGKGALIQDAFTMLSDEQREFLMTGITPEEWARAFPPEED